MNINIPLIQSLFPHLATVFNWHSAAWWWLGMLIPMKLLVGLTLKRRPGLFPYGVVIVPLLDLITAIVLLML